MILTKQKNQGIKKLLLPQLWQYKTTTVTVIEYLKYYVVIRQDKWQELIGYLESISLKSSIIIVAAQSGKTISSGRIKKGVDLTATEDQGNELLAQK